jgi:hypothetical protein
MNQQYNNGQAQRTWSATSQRNDPGQWRKLIRALDVFPKQREEASEFFQKSTSGGVITIVTGVLMAILFMSELGVYLKHRTTNTLSVDTSRGETMTVHLDISLPKMPCSWVSIDAMDVTGDVHLEVHDHGIKLQRLDRRGEPKRNTEAEAHQFGSKAGPLNQEKDLDPTRCESCYGAEDEVVKCCNTCAEVREQYSKRNWSMPDVKSVEQCVREGFTSEIDSQKGEGCRISGEMLINKVAGNIHISPGHSYQQGGVHLHDLLPFVGQKSFDMSHTIHRLAFGTEYPGMKNPLDGHKQKQKPLQFTHMEGNIPAGGTFQYYLKVVPTSYVTIGNSTIKSNQFSVTETYKEPIPGHAQLPGLFFFYDLSPVKVTYQEERRTFISFLTSACAIVGGLFTIAGIIDGTVYAGGKAVKKKMGVGKLI